jgi:hypothetical protein
MLRSLEKRIKEIESRIEKSKVQHIFLKDNKVEVNNVNGNKIYIPNSTGDLFHQDDSFVRLVMGAYGSGKSTMSVFEPILRTIQMPRWKNGTRRSKWAIVRNTSGELQSTTLQTWLSWFGDLGDINKRQKPIMTYEHAFNDGTGRVEIELIFLALDREDDLRKVRSLEVTGCYINELSEVPQGALSHFKGRVGRYPSKAFCKEDYWSGIVADTNPPDNDHWIYKAFEVDCVEGYKIFKQPPGLIYDSENDEYHTNPEADNIDHLPEGYYERLAQGQTKDFVKVFCLGEYGSVGTGKIVYPEYNDDLHCCDDLQPIQGLPLYIGQDFGLTPASVVVQFTGRGQLLVLKEYTSEGMSINTFTENVLLPGIEIDFPGFVINSVEADPAGEGRNQAFDELTCIGVMRDLGLDVYAADTNDLESRLNAVKFFLNRMVDGKPSFLISRNGCPVLRKGFIKDYNYKRLKVSGEERYRNEPDKTFSSHVHDALQYISLKFAANHIKSSKALSKEQPMNNLVFQWNG